MKSACPWKTWLRALITAAILAAAAAWSSPASRHHADLGAEVEETGTDPQLRFPASRAR